MLLNNVILVKMVRDVLYLYWSFTGSISGKGSACQYRRCQSCEFYPCIRKNPWRRAQQLTRYFCVENSMDRGAWWATVHRVIKSQTQLKWLSMHVHTYFYWYFISLLNNWERCIKISEYVHLSISFVCICRFLLYLFWTSGLGTEHILFPLWN